MALKLSLVAGMCIIEWLYMHMTAGDRLCGCTSTH